MENEHFPGIGEIRTFSSPVSSVSATKQGILLQTRHLIERFQSILRVWSDTRRRESEDVRLGFLLRRGIRKSKSLVSLVFLLGLLNETGIRYNRTLKVKPAKRLDKLWMNGSKSSSGGMKD